MAIDFEVGIKELAVYGEVATIENLKDINWIFKRLSQLGYSLSITHITPEEYTSVRATHNLGPEEDYLKELTNSECRGYFTYQLKGNQYKTRGNHNTFLLPDPHTAAMCAYVNVVKLLMRKEGNA